MAFLQHLTTRRLAFIAASGAVALVLVAIGSVIAVTRNAGGHGTCDERSECVYSVTIEDFDAPRLDAYWEGTPQRVFWVGENQGRIFGWTGGWGETFTMLALDLDTGEELFRTEYADEIPFQPWAARQAFDDPSSVYVINDQEQGLGSERYIAARIALEDGAVEQTVADSEMPEELFFTNHYVQGLDVPISVLSDPDWMVDFEYWSSRRHPPVVFFRFDLGDRHIDYPRFVNAEVAISEADGSHRASLYRIDEERAFARFGFSSDQQRVLVLQDHRGEGDDWLGVFDTRTGERLHFIPHLDTGEAASGHPAGVAWTQDDSAILVLYHLELPDGRPALNITRYALPDFSAPSRQEP